jgi:ornithine cyclodeaminase
LTVKLVTLFPHNRPPLHTHQAVICAFDPANGSPVALMDGTAITAMRTAAASALSVRLLAREDARVLTIVGTGVQAQSHAQIVPLVRDFEEIRIAGRSFAHARALADSVGAKAFEEIAAAVEGADVVCATTHAAQPVVMRANVSSGTHITSVGYNPNGPEIDTAIVKDALLVVEWRAVAAEPSPAGLQDVHKLIESGQIQEDHIVADLGELVAGTRQARTAASQITLYRSGGLAIQDAAAASLVLAEARTRGIGTHVEL